MIIARIKQGLLYIFGRYKEEWNREIESILSLEELKVFNEMGEYDRLHSYRLLKIVERDELLKNEKIFKKLALLHDCGKYNAKEIMEYLKTKNIYIRYFNIPRIDNHLRITIGTDFEMAKTVEEIENFIK